MSRLVWVGRNSVGNAGMWSSVSCRMCQTVYVGGGGGGGGEERECI